MCLITAGGNFLRKRDNFLLYSFFNVLDCSGVGGAARALRSGNCRREAVGGRGLYLRIVLLG